ncbi:ABC transporter substrate-binding protein [uncultured Nitratireductor sp.]|uniref:ABC transporter substrate-binding protein n=1 Tax=uncultured Nitratireductor sp. TaxID=520953 RepID=UPI0025F649B2|nr:ABC transporter substrate-binding protein [uncultured Nitratireductor sp.]
MLDVNVTSSPVYTNYAPCYLADALGFFADNGLRVDATIPSGPGSSWLANNLLDGKADFAMGGIWIPLSYRKRLADLPIIAMVCNRNPQIIMSRTPVETFQWGNLYDRKVMLSMSSTSQWMFLEGVMKRQGADLSRITFLRDLDVNTTVRLWRHGLADFYLVDPLMAEELEDEGYHVATTLARSCSDVPWSVYYTSQAVLDRRDGMAPAFVRSIDQALKWLHAHGDDDVARAMERWFPDRPRSLVARSVARLRGDGVWAESVEIPQGPFDQYQRIIANYGLIDAPYPFGDVVATPS